MKTKLITITLSAVLAASLLALTACGTTDESAVSSAVESSVIPETSASLGIYVQDTDNDGTPDKVVDKDGNDLSHLYTLKENGIYEGETLVLPMENTEVYTASESGEAESTEQSGEANTEAAGNTNENGTQQQQTANSNSGTKVNANTGNTGSSTNTGTYPSPSNGNNGGNTNTGTTTPPQQQPQPTVHQPIYTQQWVVDQAAWSEEVPIWGNKEVAVCNYCKVEITGNAEGHLYEHALNGIATGWHSEIIKVQTGTKTIQHEEIGHWESVLVCGGCTGTH